MDSSKALATEGADIWDGGLCVACLSGNLDIAKLAIDYCADNFDGGLLLANEKQVCKYHRIFE